MSDSLQIHTRLIENQLLVELSGQIDEDSDFSKVLSLNSSAYIFDFDKIKMMNSCGIREWINFIEKLPKSSQIIYCKCPQVVIEQINMVQGFLRPGARIDSFYAPYFSEQKDEVQKILLKTDQIISGKAPSITDPESGELLEFDAIEAQYFNFIKQQEQA